MLPDTARPGPARLSDAVQALVDATVDGMLLDDDDLLVAAAEIAQIAARLAAVRDAVPPPEDGRYHVRLHTPMPVWDSVATDDGFVARGRFTNGHTGPAGYVHGGWIALAFDEILGWANYHAGLGGLTAHLMIRYRKPTPIGADVEFRVPRPDLHGRRAHTHATLTADGILTAEAEGLFVQPRS